MGVDSKILKIPEECIWSVTAITEYIKKKLCNDDKLIQIWIRGEISNFTDHSTGHWYFTIKDEECPLECLMFSGKNKSVNFEPKRGMKVLVLGSIDLYKPHGKYKFKVEEMHQDGLGLLHQKYLKLKKKLEEEGLFDDKHKTPLPQFPKTIGVITSSTGAVVRDIITNLTRRYPRIHIKIAPTLVQGAEAAVDIVKSIKLLNQVEDIDVIILGRGGGSIEDLWCFNEESVARAIFKSKIPIISAVGHQTDYTIADFVADERAPTPSTAAEIAVPDERELLNSIEDFREKLIQKARSCVEANRKHLNLLIDRRIFKSPLDFITDHQQKVMDMFDKISQLVKHSIAMKKKSMDVIVATLKSMDPKAVFKRGYSIAMAKGKVVKNTKDVKIDDILEIIVSGGEIKSKVMEVNKND